MELIDWNEVWKRRWEWVKRNDPHRGSEAFWNKYAETYYQRMKKQGREREEIAGWLCETFGLDESSTVLEIGPGPGTYTIPLAKRVAKVTVVESSSKMIEFLRRHMEEEDVENVEVIHSRWENVSGLKAHDVVFAAYSLSVPDLREALLKMNSLAVKGACILTSAGNSGWSKVYARLFPLVYGKEYMPSHGHIVFYNLLYQLGIYANVLITRKEHTVEYGSVDEAVKDWALRLNTENLEAVRKGLMDFLEVSENVILLRYEHRDARIWWYK
ncbi:class I SAM-dependent methyltransferase [Thermococcus aciditolerans]|uniref:Class I SAM-dependent methyltransferase n=1 Tax=Thermococcus aciditolerans TaxID=2598455 RepID=A0A5C0SPX1_9EURY|nr:rRNA adenine N-6-methyltransferase family protein [Thermococcus aciditolerans]QEK14929.1 class I SAM-dependent methyltransferase [Thermococcus aciditolerans]